MNILLLLLSIILVFSALILSKALFGKTGIIGFMGIATILANILTCKCVNILGLETTLGTVMFASNFLATDILTECYGVKIARKGVLFSLCASVGFIVTTQIALLFIPNEFDIAQNAFITLFTVTPRITLSSIIMFFIANFCDINLYNFLREKTHGKYMWLRNNICTILCNGLENFLFYTIAFLGIYDLLTIISIAFVCTLIEIIIALCDTPFLYIATKIKER